MGTYAAGVKGEGGLSTDYEVPQENGNRTDVRWVAIKDVENEGQQESILRAGFGALEGASFSTSRFTVQELDKARHPFELRALAREREAVAGEEVTWLHLN